MRRGTEGAKQMGLYLRQVRERQMLSMREVARRMDSTAATVSQTEKGDRALKPWRLGLWAKALEIDVADLCREWDRCDDIQAPPIMRNRTSAVESDKLYYSIRQLRSADRSRVEGYIDRILEDY